MTLTEVEESYGSVEEPNVVQTVRSRALLNRVESALDK